MATLKEKKDLIMLIVQGSIWCGIDGERTGHTKLSEGDSPLTDLASAGVYSARRTASSTCRSLRPI